MISRSHFHEVAMYWRNRPLQYFVGRASNLFGPVAYLPLNTTYFVNDIEIARTILMDTDHFSLAHAGGLGYLISEIMGKEAPALFNMEGEKHLALKRSLMEVFKPQYLNKIIEEALSPEFEKIEPDQEIDLVRLSKRCTSRLSCHMLGMSDKHDGYETLIETVASLSDDLTRMLSITQVYPTQKQKKHGQAIYNRFCKLIKEYYNSKHLPKNSIISKLKSDGLSFDEAKALLVTLIIAGTETVANAMPRIAAIMIDNNRWIEISQKPDLLPAAISEGLRITSPAPVIVHGVKKTTQIKGITFIENRRVLIMLLNMLRNNAFFENAMEFNLERQHPPQYRNFWFGAGPHYCLGAQLANFELSFVYKKLLELCPNPSIVTRKYSSHTSFPGYRLLTIRNK